MPANKQFQMLLSPFQIRDVKLKNRIVKSPQGTNSMDDQGAPSDITIPYYESVAKGGVGLIIAEATAIDHPMGAAGFPGLLMHDDKLIPAWRKLTNLVHKHDCKIVLQLFHGGPAHPKFISGNAPLSASTLTKQDNPFPAADSPREITIPEIKDSEQKFAQAAARAQKAGFDGVEFHAAHRYLLNSFLSCAYNKRTDEYGCQDIESRARITTNALKAARQLCGETGFVIGVRMNVREWGLNNGITLPDSQAFAKLFEKAGADYIHVTGYGYNNFLWGYWGEQLRFPEAAPEVRPWLKTIRKPGFIVAQAEHIKRQVSVPVITGGRISPQVAEQDLRQGKMDLFFVGRRLFCDVELPIKVAEGRLEDIAPCTACRECWNAIAHNTPVRCRINAALSRELEYAIKPAPKKKKVLVVGGGPAGLEAARVAALRGHEVSLYEKDSRLGGQINLAAMVKGLQVENLDDFIRYFQTQMTKLGVKVNLGKEVTPAEIERLKPDAVILATGGKPTVPDIPGIDNKIVIKSGSLYRRSKPFLMFFGPGFLRWLTNFYVPFGKSVVVIGGDIEGLELAEFLVKRGKKVTVVEASETFGANMVTILVNQLVPWLVKKGATLLNSVKYEEITDKGLTVTTKDGKKQTIEADNIVTALPLSPNPDMVKAFEGKVPEIYPIGDCREPHRILHAIQDGARVGRLV